MLNKFFDFELSNVSKDNNNKEKNAPKEVLSFEQLSDQYFTKLKQIDKNIDILDFEDFFNNIDDSYDDFFEMYDGTDYDEFLFDSLDPYEIEEYDREMAIEDLFNGVYDKASYFQPQKVKWDDGEYFYEAEILAKSDPRIFLHYDPRSDLEKIKVLYKIFNLSKGHLLVSRFQTINDISEQDKEVVLSCELSPSREVFVNSRKREQLLSSLYNEKTVTWSAKRVRRLLYKYNNAEEDVVLEDVQSSVSNNKSLDILKTVLRNLQVENEKFKNNVLLTDKIGGDLESLDNQGIYYLPESESVNGFDNKNNYILSEKKEITNNYKNELLRELDISDVVPIFLMEAIAYKETGSAGDDFLSEYIENIQYIYKYLLQKERENLDALSFVNFNDKGHYNGYLLSYLQENEIRPEEQEIFLHDIAVIDRREGVGTKLLSKYFDQINNDEYLQGLDITAEIRGVTMFKAMRRIQKIPILALKAMGKLPGKKAKKYKHLVKLKKCLSNYEIELSEELSEAEENENLEDKHYEIRLRNKRK